MDVGQSMKVSSTGLGVSILITPSGGRCGRLASLWLCFAGLIASRGLLPRLLWTMDTKRESVSLRRVAASEQVVIA